MEKQSPSRRQQLEGLQPVILESSAGLTQGDPSATKAVLWVTSSRQRLGLQAVFISELFWLGGRWESRFSLNLSRSWKYG